MPVIAVIFVALAGIENVMNGEDLGDCESARCIEVCRSTNEVARPSFVDCLVTTSMSIKAASGDSIDYHQLS